MKLSIKKRSKSTFTIQCDPGLIDEIIFIMSKLMSMSQEVKRLAKHNTSQRRVKNQEFIVSREKKFNSLSKKVYQLYSIFI